MAFIAAWGRQVQLRRRLQSRFRGPMVICEAGQRRHYAPLRYRAVGALPDSLDAVTGSSVSLRLRSPSVYREREPAATLCISYPPNGAVFPPNLCAPFVEWDDPVNDLWQVQIEIEGVKDVWRHTAEKPRWRIPNDLWRVVRQQAVGRDASIQVLGLLRSGARPSVQASQPVRVRVSADPADDCIVYRLVELPFSTRSSPDTFARHISSFETRPFILGRRRYCFNCHMFSSQSGRAGKVTLQCRYMVPEPCPLRVYFGVYDIGEQRGWKVKLPFGIQMTTFTAWSPDGARLAISANQQIEAVAPVVSETQNVHLPTSDIAIYDVAASRAYLLPGASSPDRLAVYPRWTPDGQSLVFCDAPSGPNTGERAKFSLLVVPFNDGQGGTAKPIAAAGENGRSNYYPRFSPDGKWLSFCQSDGGSLIKSSSDIWLMSGSLEGPARPLGCNVPYAADSWHSWSSNSRWLVFASKRDDGLYARLYLTHVDDTGHASPAVRLPVNDRPSASFNIPEFMAEWPQVQERELFDAIRVERDALNVAEEEAK